jgi:nickel transport protein
MKNSLPIAAALAVAAGLSVRPLLAHGLDIEVRRHHPAVVLRAAYAGTEPAAYVSVEIFAPEKSDVKYQAGYSDAAGCFAFVPDREGDWRAVFDDELGHREEIIVPIDRAFLEAGVTPGSEAPSSRLPLWQRALAGVMLIFGISGFLYGFKLRRRAVT